MLVLQLTEIDLLLNSAYQFAFHYYGAQNGGNQFCGIKNGARNCGLALVLANVDFPNVTNDNILVEKNFGGFFRS